ncbi:MAG: hypothetical protein PF517_08810 [Salinivirgaceae bacterium]|jgi:hypothetical protein|nr:hypothetical protein [Salinivirgaceae bacterium]
MTNAKKEQHTCLYCQNEIKGRSDKKFCDANCRSAYHNQTANNQEHFIRSINKQLRANRAALKKACPWGKATVRKDFLKQLGMDFKHITHTWKSAHGNLYFFCYDYGYMQIEDAQKVLIVQQQNYMKK